MDLFTTLVILATGIFLEAFFSGSEIAMISINRVRMKQRAEEGKRGTQAVLDLLNTPEKLFATTSLGTNIAVVTSTAVFTGFMVMHLGKPGEILSMIIISPIILFFGEIVPKIFLQHKADTLMPYLVYPLNFFCKIFGPVSNLTTRLSNFFTQGLMKTGQENKITFSRDQIRSSLSLDSQTMDLGPTERKMIHRIFSFGEIAVDQCMVPLVQMYCISDTANLGEAHKIAIDSGFSRLPVYHERIHNLIGILNTFDLINQPIDATPIADLIRPAYYVPNNKKIDDLLKELQARSLHMAVVVDEYGGCIGLATIEDLLEEIVGEIEDEYDKPEKQYEPYTDGGFLIEGDMEINSINEILELNLPTSEDFETLAGLVIGRLEKIPLPGEQVEIDKYRLTVKEASKRKIISVIVREFIQKENGGETSPPANAPRETE